MAKTLTRFAMFLAVATFLAAPSAPSIAGEDLSASSGALQSFRVADREQCQNGCLRITRDCKRRGEDGCYVTHQRCWNACKRNYRS